MNNVRLLLFLFLPAILVGLATYWLVRTLVNTRQPYLLFLSIGLLLVPPFLFFFGALASDSWSFIIILPAFIATITAFVVGNVFFITGTSRRKRLVLTGVYPVFLLFVTFLGIVMGYARSPEGRTEQFGATLIQALEQYQSDHGVYPPSLHELVSTHLAEIPPVLSASGVPWLYTTNGHEFTLGYMQFPERTGSELCLYVSSSRMWSCEFNNWGPFTPIPTWVFTPTPHLEP